MKKYFEPHPLWKTFGAKDRDEYLEKYVIEGSFHIKVPKDIVDAFFTAEYLMAHAYYHWQMYDEARNKIFRILEMAVKLKAKQKNIALTTRNTRGRERAKTLSTLIDEVCAEAHFFNLKADLHRARNFRNYEMHPDRNSYMGASGNTPNNIRFFINMLNQLFLSDEKLKEQHEICTQVKLDIDSLNQDILTLDNGTERYLLNQIFSFKYVNGFLFLSCEPILLNAFSEISQKKYFKPLTVALKDFSFYTDKISGLTIDNSGIKIIKTEKEVNIKTVERFRNEYEKLTATDKAFYELHLKTECPWEIEKHIYQYSSKIYLEKNLANSR